MVVDHPGGLHERIADRRTHELQPPREEISAHRFRLFRSGGYLSHRAPAVLNRTPGDEAPGVSIEAPELSADLEKSRCVSDGRQDLLPVADDPGVTEQALHLLIAVGRDRFRVERQRN